MADTARKNQLDVLENILSGVTRTSLGYFNSNALSSAVSLAVIAGGTIPTNTTRALVIIEGSTVRWRSDGVAPTASIGMPAQIGDVIEFDQKQLDSVKLIGAGATVHVEFYC